VRRRPAVSVACERYRQRAGTSLRDRFVIALTLSLLLAVGCRTTSPVRPGGFGEADRLLDDFRARRAFPGGVLAVGYRGALVHLHPFGRLTYDANAPAVTAGTLYDLASLTKVVATTTMAMILVDEGKLDLDQRVQTYLPGFQGPGKEAVTVRHLLTHSSGLDATAPLYKELSGKEAFVERIERMDLVYPPGSRSLYSDLGIILLGEILEKVAGQPLEAFVRERVFAPLAMRHTMFRPPAELRPRIAPTEVDPWRGRLVQGEVHDENAFAMGGVAPHAGLFSTAGDLARFAQMLLNGGTLDGRRIVSGETVELFTRRTEIPGSDRALGWDTKSAEGSAGTLFSPRSFGHTGFTGTSMWIDPARQLYVILLTNRVHPTRDNQLIREARPAVADAVVRALNP
jgi:CubicO group peptidase (beta-lactamase class C family)